MADHPVKEASLAPQEQRALSEARRIKHRLAVSPQAASIRMRHALHEGPDEEQIELIEPPPMVTSDNDRTYLSKSPQADRGDWLFRSFSVSIFLCSYLSLFLSRSHSVTLTLAWVWASALQPHTRTLTHSHTFTITCTCCHDEINEIQDQDLFSCSFSDSLSLSLSLSVYLATHLLIHSVAQV